jgi:Cof subfamily protein (haloacid dehalogenase superfamily)
VKPNEDQINLPQFQKRPGAIAIDIDGTLLNNKSQLSERNAMAIKNCIAQGIPVIIATSRPARSVRRLLGMEIMNACSLVMQNGAIGTGRPPLTGNIKEIIPRKIFRGLMAAVLEMEPEIRITFELEGESFGTNNPRDPVSLWERNSATPDMQLTLEEALKGEPTKIAIGGLERDITHVAEMLLKHYGDTLSIVGEAGKTFFNITSKTASKSNTIRRLLQSQNIPLESVVALGDDLPDYDMLSACGFPIAVANAVPEIKAICRYSTASNNDDGVALVLEKILEIGK